jgi:hypothetical protein
MNIPGSKVITLINEYGWHVAVLYMHGVPIAAGEADSESLAVRRMWRTYKINSRLGPKRAR